MQRMRKVPAGLVILAGFAAAPAFAQGPPPPPPPQFPPQQLDQLVARIALYPDPLLAQVLAAATYPHDLPAADQWPWDPSVQALLPFPSVLDMMNADMGWTTQIGNAFLAQQLDVMDAVQRQRGVAQRYGYLRTNGQVVVGGGPYITIAPVNPAFVVVPYYDPAIVFFAPRAGFVIGGAIRFGFGVTIGGFFAPWGWAPGGIRFDWGAHAVFLNNARWGRTWANRATYVHPYPAVRRVAGGARPAERHEVRPRSEEERNAP